MFAWLDEVLGGHPRPPGDVVYFRAHPDEDAAWSSRVAKACTPGYERRRSKALPNVCSSRRTSMSARTNGAALQICAWCTIPPSVWTQQLWAQPCCAAVKRATPRYRRSSYPPARQPTSEKAEEFLALDNSTYRPNFSATLAIFLYYQLYKTSLPFEALLTQDLTPGFVRLRREAAWQDFTPTSSPTMHTLVDGLFARRGFSSDG